MPDKDPFWTSQRFWLTLSAIVGVVVMSCLGVIDGLTATDIMMVMSALVLGKSLEQGLQKSQAKGCKK